MHVTRHVHSAGGKNGLAGLGVYDVVNGAKARRIGVGLPRGVDLRVEKYLVRFLETIAPGWSELHALHQQRRAVGEQFGVERIAGIRNLLQLVAHGHAAQAEGFSVVGINHERRFVFSEFLAAAGKDHGQPVLSGRDLELIFVVHGRLRELLPFLFFEIHVELVAEARGYRTIRPVGDAENIDVRVIFSLAPGKFDGRGRNLHGQIDAGFVGRGVEEGRLHRPFRCDGNGSARTSFEFFLDGLAGQEVGVLHVAVAAARAHVGPAYFDLHLQRVATAVGRTRRNVAEQIVFVLFARDLLQTGKQVVGIQDGEAAGSRREHVHYLLIGARGLRERRNDVARLIVKLVVVGVVARTGIASGVAASAGAATAPTAVTSTAASTSAATPTTAVAAPSSAAPAATMLEIGHSDAGSDAERS